MYFKRFSKDLVKVCSVYQNIPLYEHNTNMRKSHFFDFLILLGTLKNLRGQLSLFELAHMSP